MAKVDSETPGSGLDAAPPKTLTEKLTDTISGIIQRDKKRGDGSEINKPPKI